MSSDAGAMYDQSSWQSYATLYTLCGGLLLIGLIVYKHTGGTSSIKGLNSVLGSSDDSITALVERANAEHRLPALVQMQMLINWTQQFTSAHLDTLEKRFEHAFKRLEEIDRMNQQAQLSLRFESVQLIKGWRHCGHLGITPVHVGVQATPEQEYQGGAGDRKSVRFKLPTEESGASDDDREISVIDRGFSLCSYLFGTLRCLWLILKGAFAFLMDPHRMRVILLKLVEWSKLWAKFSVDVSNDYTEVEFSLLPTLPESMSSPTPVPVLTPTSSILSTNPAPSNQ